MSYIAIQSAVYYHDVFGPFQEIEEAKRFVEGFVKNNADNHAPGDGHHEFEVHQMADGRMDRHCCTFESTGKRYGSDGNFIPSVYAWRDLTPPTPTEGAQ